jgi:DNA polymerase
LTREQDELKDLSRALKRRVALSDASDWKTPAATRAPVDVPKRPEKPLERSFSFEKLSEEIKACRACPLGSSRIQAVSGVGSPTAEVMFVGEGPGYEEDHRGEPFVGKSGQLLDKIMESIGLSRKTVYIANIVKCHPMKNPADPESRGNDRPPTQEEIAACRGWLDAQIRAIKPRFIVTLGNVPAKVLLDEEQGITKIRGRWRSYDPGGGAPAVRLMPTFHPAALLRDPNLKRDVWNDMKSLREELSK